MKLYNQSRNKLDFSLGGHAYECGPWGEVEMTEELLPFVRKRGLPLDVTPVAPEVKASRQAQEAKSAAEGAEVVSLKRELIEARAAEKEAKGSLEAALLNVKDLHERLELSGMECDELKGKVAALEGDKAALEKQLAEQAKLLAELEAETAPKPKQPAKK